MTRPVSKSIVGTKASVKGHEQRLARQLRHDLEDVARAVVHDAANPAERHALIVLGPQAHEIDVVELVGLRRRQAVARDEQFGVGEARRGVAVVDALDAGDQHVVLQGAQRQNREGAASIPGRERAIGTDVARLARVGLDPHLALDPLGGAEHPDQNPRLAHPPRHPHRPEPPVRPGLPIAWARAGAIEKDRGAVGLRAGAVAWAVIRPRARRTGRAPGVEDVFPRGALLIVSAGVAPRL